MVVDGRLERNTFFFFLRETYFYVKKIINIYIYIYIERERERERESYCISKIPKKADGMEFSA